MVAHAYRRRALPQLTHVGRGCTNDAPKDEWAEIVATACASHATTHNTRARNRTEEEDTQVDEREIGEESSTVVVGGGVAVQKLQQFKVR
jgi:2,4-dienoyl-CoA reductase-like NADH-dependent reductase (Old Yellow Enzyme family)